MMATQVETVKKVESEPGNKSYSVCRTQPHLYEYASMLLLLCWTTNVAHCVAGTFLLDIY